MSTEHTDNHGQTPAAWTAVLMMLVGFTLGGVAVVISAIWLFWVSLIVIVIGGVAGWIMKAMGMGQGSSTTHAAGR
jgi:hypothetical protein